MVPAKFMSPWMLIGLASVAACAPTANDEPTGHVAQAQASVELIDVYVVLDGPSAVASTGKAAASGRPQAIARTRKRLRELQSLRDSVRPALLGTGAIVVAELSRLANAFQVRMPPSELDKLRALPHVASVERVPLFEHSLHSGLPTVAAAGAWGGMTPLHGSGVSVGILDTGIDYLHADFGGRGDPVDFENDDPTMVETGTFPTARVLGGYDFAGDDYDPSEGMGTPAPDDDPIDCGGHGSHVAGISAGGGVLDDRTAFAGPYEQSLDLAQFRVAPGVAPLADLYALKVFGCEGSTALVASGLEWAADPNGDGDFSDRLDVVNASLGGAYGFPTPTNKAIIAAYHELGGLFVAAAGNEGNTFFVTGSPGTFPEALSVAATVDSSLITLQVASPASIAGDYGAVEGGFTAPLLDSGSLDGELVYAQPPLACAPIDNSGSIAGKIALIDRGDCLFFDKLTHAIEAGAVGVVMVQHTLGVPFAMGSSDMGDVDIPAVMISRADGERIKQGLAGDVAVALTRNRFAGDAAEVVAGLSSRGPTTEGGLLKPEIAAPGVAVDSADVGTGSDPTSKQGTSMATPFVAGAAVLVREVAPSLSPSEVKAILINTAVPLVDADAQPFPISMQGAGRLDVSRAVSQRVLATVEGVEGEVAITFDPIASAVPTSTERRVRLDNKGDDAVTFALTASQVNPLPGVSVSLDPPALTVGPGETATFIATLQVDPVALRDPGRDPVTPGTQRSLPRHVLNEADGHIHLSDTAGDQSLLLPFYGVVRAASDLWASPPRGCAVLVEEVPHEQAVVTLEGTSAHPNASVSAFELGVDAPADAGLPRHLDIRAVGVATDAHWHPRFDESSVHFAIAVDGEWTTPARGGYSVFSITIDSDRDGTFDYALRIEPLNNDDPYYDVLATTVYDVTGEVGSKRYANLVPANEADTQPFFNSVLVFSVFARDIGLDEDNSRFAYFASSDGVLGRADTTERATFDVLAPQIDAARLAPLAGVPLFSANEPVSVELGERNEDGTLPGLLLLHHNGTPGARYEVVDVGSYTPDQLAVTHTFADRTSGKIEIRNDGDEAVQGVTLTGSISNGSVALAAPSHGDCSRGASIDCTIGAIPPGASRTITLQVSPTTMNAPQLVLAVRSAAGCEVALDIAIAPEDKTAPPPGVAPSGGCGCRTAPTPERSAGWLWLGVVATLLRFRRPRHPLSEDACASSREPHSESDARARVRVNGEDRAHGA